MSEHETYNGIDNFIKYFIKVSMTYKGGSMFAGDTLEKLHEVEVKNSYVFRQAKKRQDEQKT